MKYIYQTCHDLQLYLVEGDCDVSQFVILKTESFEWHKKNFTFGILGASHFIEIVDGDQKFTEICACVPGTFDKPDKIHLASALSILPQRIECTFQNCNYTFEHHCMTLTQAKMISSDCMPDTTHLENKSMYHEFPSHNAGEAPFTKIALSRNMETLVIKTIHTYPNENSAVFTTSTIALL